MELFKVWDTIKISKKDTHENRFEHGSNVVLDGRQTSAVM